MKRFLLLRGTIWRYLPSAAILTGCLALTLTLFVMDRRLNEQAARAAFNRQAGQLVGTIRTDIGHRADQLFGIEGYFNADGTASRQDFHRFAQDTARRFPDVQVLEWVPRVEGDQRAAYETSAQKDGFPSFGFLDQRGSDIAPAGQHAEYFPVYYVEPLLGNEEVLGLNQASNEACLEALTTARDSGQPTLSAPLTLVRRDGAPQGTLLYVPIYGTSEPPNTVGERREALTGFVVSALRVDAIVAGADAAQPKISMAVTLTDLDVPSGTGLLYASAGRNGARTGVPGGIKGSDRLDIPFQATLQLAGRHWLFVAEPDGETIPGKDQTAAILVGGLTVTGLLGLYLLMSLRRSRQAERLRAEAVVSWREAETLRAEAVVSQREAEALHTAAAALTSQADPEAVLRALVEQAALALSADRAIYGVLRDGELSIRATWQQGTWIEEDRPAQLKGVLALVWTSGQPYYTDDATDDARSDPNGTRSLAERHHTRARLSVPLLSPAGERLGIVALNNRDRAQGFSAREQRFVIAICEMAATILVRARDAEGRLVAEQAARDRAREVGALLRVADQVNSAVDPEEVLLRVAEVAGELLAVGRVAIFSNEGDHVLHRYDWSAGSWKQSSDDHLPLDGSFSGWVISHAQPYRSEDIGLDSIGFRPLYEKNGATRVLAVPVMSHSGQVNHVLCLFDPIDERPFSDGDQRLAEGVAYQASMALQRTTLVQELRGRERHLRHQAVTDPLTGLSNRALFFERLEHSLTTSAQRNTGVTVLFLDLDGFKLVNDSLGHETGDKLLVAVGKRLRAARRSHDCVARLGGDEFAILLDSVDEAADALVVAERVVASLRRPLSIEGQHSLYIGASIGVSFHAAAAETSSASELIREADIALYRAKATGRGRAVLFEPSMNAAATERLELQSDLSQALRRGDLRVYFQPIVDLQTQTVIGAEALVRWAHRRHGLLQPDRFIPLAEETGLILPIGRWVLEEACRQAQSWQVKTRDGAPFFVSVNLSVLQLGQADIVAQVQAALGQSGLEPDRLELEITESAVLGRGESTLATLAALRKLGVHLAIDDFGTGYSSLSYLQRLPAETVKLDQSFVQGLETGNATAAIVRAVVTLAHALGMRVTAEGIETPDALSSIAALGCDFGQGYLFARPSELEQFQDDVAAIDRRPFQRSAEDGPQLALDAPLRSMRV